MSDLPIRAVATDAVSSQPPSREPPCHHTSTKGPHAGSRDGGVTFGDRLWRLLRLGEPFDAGPGRGLPVPQPWTPPGTPSAHYTVSAMDTWGRLADRSSVTALGWRPGLHLALTARPTAVVAAPDPLGRDAITRQGHVRLPASLRHLFGLAAGDRLLVAACPDRGFLVIHPIAVLDAMVLAHHHRYATDGRTP
jgi:hypothetical protein